MLASKSSCSGIKARSRLIEIVSQRSLLRDTDVTLASGLNSNFYFDMKQTAFHPEGASLIGDLMLDALIDLSVSYVGGLEMGAVPLVTCVVQRSVHYSPIGGFFVRKQPKPHGTRRLIEGLHRDESLNGKTVVLLEDVTTTGNSVIRAVEAVRAEGANIPFVLTLLDRLSGAQENLARHDISLKAILTLDDFTI